MHTALGNEMPAFLTGVRDAAATLTAIEEAYTTTAREAGVLKQVTTAGRGESPVGHCVNAGVVGGHLFGHLPKPRLRHFRAIRHDKGDQMKAKIFFAFVAPSVVMMFLFIALPLVSVLIQPFQIANP